MMSGTAGLSPQHVAQGCPEAAGYSMHFPMQHCGDKCLRILQFVESECEALPSSAKAPYLLTVELLEQPFPCQHEKLYTQGHAVGMLTIDAINRKSLPYLPAKTEVEEKPRRLVDDSCSAENNDVVECLSKTAPLTMSSSGSTSTQSIDDFARPDDFHVTPVTPYKQVDIEQQQQQQQQQHCQQQQYYHHQQQHRQEQQQDQQRENVDHNIRGGSSSQYTQGTPCIHAVSQYSKNC